MKYILNYGGGVNSTALAIEMIKRNLPLDAIVFADTGAELPETYAFVNRFEKWLASKGKTLTVVRSQYGNIYDYYFARKTIPYRKFRDCTDKFKVVPIGKFLKQYAKEPLTQFIGIALEEKQRAKNRKAPNKRTTFAYPLIDWGINREGCKHIIIEAGLPLPVKSGCYFCPFQPAKSWAELLDKHPELFAKAERIEKANASYPKNALTWKHNLETLRKAKKDQRLLMDYSGLCGGFDGTADCKGFCMT